MTDQPPPPGPTHRLPVRPGRHPAGSSLRCHPLHRCPTAARIRRLLRRRAGMRRPRPDRRSVRCRRSPTRRGSPACWRSSSTTSRSPSYSALVALIQGPHRCSKSASAAPRNTTSTSTARASPAASARWRSGWRGWWRGLPGLELRLPPGDYRVEHRQVGDEVQGGQRDHRAADRFRACRWCASSRTSLTRSSVTSDSCFRCGTPSGKPWPTRS